jgi:hypothetical protein
MSKTPTTEERPSAAELSARAAARKRRATEIRIEAVAALNKQLRAAEQAEPAEHAAAAAELDAALEPRWTALQRRFDETCSPIIRRLMTEPTRADIRALRSALQKIDAAAIVDVGDPLFSYGGTGWGIRLLALSVASVVIAHTPEAVHAFARSSIGNEQAGRALRALHHQGSDPEAQLAFQELEASVAQVTRLPFAAEPDSAERFEILRFGGSPAAIAAKIDALNAARKKAAERAADAHAVAWRAHLEASPTISTAHATFAYNPNGADMLERLGVV